MSQQPGIEKIYLYAKDPYEANYQFLINKRENAGLKHFKDSKAFDIWMVFIKIHNLVLVYQKKVID